MEGNGNGNGNGGSNGGDGGTVVDITKLMPEAEARVVEDRTFLIHMLNETTHMHSGYIVLTPTFVSILRGDYGNVIFMSPIENIDFVEQVMTDELQA